MTTLSAMARPTLAAAAALAAALAAAAVLCAEQPAVATLAVGERAPDFDLPGVDGRRYTLRDFAGARILVVVFTANHCPTAQAYEERLQKIAEEYRAKGVALVAISPNDPKALRLDELGYSDLGDSLEEVAVRAKERGFTFPYLYDGDTQAASRRYGPTATPHVFVFDVERRLRFAGRVDDSENPEKVTTSDTRNAIDALLAGRPVPVEKTKVFGCSIKWAEKRAWVEEGLKKWAAEPVTVEQLDVAGLRALARNESGNLRLVNVWATWCGPCVIEFPELVEINRMYRNRAFEMVTVSADDLDQAAGVMSFLQRQQASMRNLHFQESDPYKMIDALDPEWSGALPHTVLLAPGGRVLYRAEGAFDGLKLKRAIVGWLGRYYHSKPGGVGH